MIDLRKIRVPMAIRWERFVFPEPMSGCWLWTGQLALTGYGIIRGETGKQAKVLAHRVSWELHNKRPIPDGLFICHKCNNRACVNPEHLYAGTAADNMADAVRARQAARRDGEASPRAKKLSDADVVAIRRRNASGEPRRNLIAEYRVSSVTIGDIVALRQRRNVT